MSAQLQLVSFVQKQSGIQWNTAAHRSIVWKYAFLLHVLNKNENIVNAGYDNNNNNNIFFEKILLTTMLTIKILFTINSLEKKKKLFIQNNIYNSCRFKKHLI